MPFSSFFSSTLSRSLSFMLLGADLNLVFSAKSGLGAVKPTADFSSVGFSSC
jgi:hypothetical protein